MRTPSALNLTLAAAGRGGSGRHYPAAYFLFAVTTNLPNKPVGPSLCSKLNNMLTHGFLFVPPATPLQVDQHVTKTIKVTTSDGLPMVRERLQ